MSWVCLFRFCWLMLVWVGKLVGCLCSMVWFCWLNICLLVCFCVRVGWLGDRVLFIVYGNCIVMCSCGCSFVFMFGFVVVVLRMCSWCLIFCVRLMLLCVWLFVSCWMIVVVMFSCVLLIVFVWMWVMWLVILLLWVVLLIWLRLFMVMRVWWKLFVVWFRFFFSRLWGWVWWNGNVLLFCVVMLLSCCMNRLCNCWWWCCYWIVCGCLILFRCCKFWWFVSLWYLVGCCVWYSWKFCCWWSYVVLILIVLCWFWCCGCLLLVSCRIFSRFVGFWKMFGSSCWYLSVGYVLCCSWVLFRLKVWFCVFWKMGGLVYCGFSDIWRR